MAGKRTEADKASNRETQNIYSTTYIKLSNMWRKRNDVYVERLSATNTHKSEGFRNARRRLYRAAKCHKRSDKSEDFQTVRHLGQYHVRLNLGGGPFIC